MRVFLSTLSLFVSFWLSNCPVTIGAEPVRCVVEADSTLAWPRFSASRLFDGDRTGSESRWASARSPETHWVSLTLAKPVSVDRIVVHAHEQPDLVLRAAAIQVQDGDAWRSLAAVDDNDRTPIEFSFTPCKASTIRLWITDACQRDSTARLFEIELFAGNEKIGLVVSTPGSATQPRVDDQVLLDAVQPLPDSLFPAQDGNTRNGRLLGRYQRAVRRWGDVLAQRVMPVPDRPGEAYYGRGGHREDDIRPIGYAVMVNGLLWRMGRCASENSIDPGFTSERAIRYRDDAIAALRYLTASHVTGLSTCLNGKRWGNVWQSAMWTRAAGFGAWALWNELDPDVQLAAARMIEYEADRLLDHKPKSSVGGDTGAEENAWNALILSLAANMMPRHPRAKTWDGAAKKYMYNVFSVPADAEDASLGDDGLPVNSWVTTVNAHEDFTVENHGLVHMGYQKTSTAQLLENAVHYLVVGKQPPMACRHHVGDAAELLYQCAGWDGAPVYFGGNDWKIVHTQPTDLPIYAILSLVADDRRAALQEQRGLEWTGRLQAAEDGFFNVRRDLEYGGLCATRLAACYLAHAAYGAGAEPLPPEAFDEQVTGNRRLDGGRAILHRSGAKFASFAYGPKWLALTIPSGPDRTIWPHYASYLGLIDGEGPTEKLAERIHLSPPHSGNGFWVVGRLRRCEGNVQHDFAFVSPDSDVTLYVERIRCLSGFQTTTCETGIVGHEYDIGSNRRMLWGRFGSLEVKGTGGAEKSHELVTDWLNVGNRIGYVVKRLPKSQNVVRYHDLSKGSGRVPKLQEWFSLIGNAEKTVAAGDQWACVVTYPNRRAEAMEALADGARFQKTGDSVRVSAPLGGMGESATIRVDFSTANVSHE